MRKWGGWTEDGAILTHRKSVGRVSTALVRNMRDIPAAMEVAYNLHAIGPLDLIHLAAALIELLSERETRP